ncbi:uncharacterized protein LOC107271557 isoform X2 [Cephus cinctus]|uniref:Uncharacterized protein LOC107271557 isoform X2 n=1 Tax=Cephus cinctus TaxID=211228 RepID=A0AAJ7C7W5_CEPCN|nr:uncharacterized protein LOC107271557 isoform X2 [Cephus cinctus]
MMRRVNLVTFLCLCTALFCRVSSFEASWDKKLNDDREISPYSEYQQTLWYRKPRYSGSSVRNYGNLGIAGSSPSRIQDYSQVRSIDPYSSNLGYNSYNRPARSRDSSYYSQATSALEDDPYGNLDSFTDRSDSRVRLYDVDSIEDPYQSRIYKVQEEYKTQPQTRGKKLYVVPRGDSRNSYLRDADGYDSIPRMKNFKADKELEDVVKKAIILAKMQSEQEIDNNHNIKDVRIDQVPSTELFRNSDVVYTPEVKHNPYNLPIGPRQMKLPSVNIGNRDSNFEALSEIDKRNDDDLNLAEMTRISKANQERDFTLADDVTFGDVQKREYPEEIAVPDDDMDEEDDVIEDMPNVAFGEDVDPVREKMTLIESNEDFNGKLGEEANDDVLEGDVVLGEAMEEDEQEGNIIRGLPATADESSLKNDDKKLIENSSIAEVPFK